MKITRKQWIMVLIGALLILLLWYMSKQKGSSGQGAATDTNEDTSEGDATLTGPTEGADISSSTGIGVVGPTGVSRGDRANPRVSATTVAVPRGVSGEATPIRKDVLI